MPKTLTERIADFVVRYEYPLFYAKEILAMLTTLALVYVLVWLFASQQQ